MKGAGLLRRAMKVHGGTVDRFARDVLGRSRVSIWRWKRNHPMPDAVIDRLKSYLANPTPTATRND